jgi:hypothetical protein
MTAASLGSWHSALIECRYNGASRFFHTFCRRGPHDISPDGPASRPAITLSDQSKKFHFPSSSFWASKVPAQLLPDAVE